MAKKTRKKRPKQDVSSGNPNGQRRSQKLEDKHKSAKVNELIFLFLLVTAVVLTVSLIGYRPDDHIGWLGRAGAFCAASCAQLTFGHIGALAVPLAIFIVLTWWISGRTFRALRWVIAVLSVGFFTGFGRAFIAILKGTPHPDWTKCGTLPAIISEQADVYLHPLGTILISATILIALAVILFNFKVIQILQTIITGLALGVKSILTTLTTRQIDGTNQEFPEEDYDSEESIDIDTSAASNNYNNTTGIPDEAENDFAIEATSVASEGPVKKTAGARELPPISLLDPPPPDRPEVDVTELEENSRRLEEKLASMRIAAKVIRTNPGPIITRYDLEPAADVKIARIVSLTDDIAMALKARGVRILAPIPGEAAVGIEIPNRYTQTVYIREIIGSDAFRQAKGPLTMAFGKDTNGQIFCADLTSMPHLLIAGATGSGKSVCMNCIIASILYRCDPKDVRLVLIDPKKIELSLYSQLSNQHLVSPRGLGEDVITTPENAVKTLQSIHLEMERRYNILAEVGVRSLGEYNRWIEASAPAPGEGEDKREKLPYIVVIIDELADLMMSVRRDFEELVVRLAQMARAVGIHLVVATQRPSVDVVTGLIKANFPSRIAFRVATKVDARTIIDTIGAEALLGRGDMLFMGLGGSRLKRLHGALITTEEAESIVEFVRAQPPVESAFKLPDPEAHKVLIAANSGNTTNIDGVDELFEEAARIVVNTEQGSVSVLQRRLRVGYARAARLIDQLEQAGIVGPFDGSKARQVMVTAEELHERYGISL